MTSYIGTAFAQLPLLLLFALLLLLGSPCLSKAQEAQKSELPPLSRPTSRPRVAIVGGGVAAASAAYFLHDLLANFTSSSDAFDIDVYAAAEDKGAATEVGGRLALAQFDGRWFESGGSIIHEKNLYMRHFAQRVLGLTALYQTEEMRLAVYNGKETVLDTSDWYLVKMAQLLNRYGVSAFVKLRRFVAAMLGDFGRVYARQNQGQAFTSVGRLLESMSEKFVAMTRESIEKTLLDLDFDSEFVNELVAGAMRNNYGQNATIHGFVGAVSLAGADGGLWSVRGGNRLVPEGLLDRFVGSAAAGGPACPGCRLRRGRRVTRIARDKENGWLVDSVGPEKEEATTERFDRVILTAPAHQGFNIQLEGASVDRVDYQTTVATFVKGQLNHDSLGLASSQERYCLFTGTPRAPIDFNSIGFQFDVEGRASDAVYKVFSQQPLTPAQLERLFSRVDAHASGVSWLAYPLYTSRLDPANASFVLADGLYHTAPVELAASAMEMAAISGRNAALLAFNSLAGRAASMTDPSVGNPPLAEESVQLRHSEL